MHTTTQTSVGERVQLARYRVNDTERIVCGQRIGGVVRLTDIPADGPGRRYLIDRGLEQDGYSALQALIADYLGQARRLDAIPMADNLLARELRDLAS